MKPADWLQKFGSALEKGDINAAAGLFEPDGYWRDLVSFTWNLKTCEGRAEIKAMLAATLAGQDRGISPPRPTSGSPSRPRSAAASDI